MDGLRSTRRRRKAGVFFCLFIFLAFPPCLPGEEPSTGNGTQNESSAIDVEAQKRKITDEAPAELVNLNLGDSSVSLNLSGRWKGTLEGSWGMALTPFGSSAITGENPIFAQEGDLTLSLWIRNRWFVETSFIDNSTLNTYRAGYQGTEGEAVRYVGIGNTGLDFPTFPYLDLGGDSPSSFGAYGHFTVGNLDLHSLVRYDAAAREERVFVGDRERSYSYTDLSRPQRGISFVLPDQNLGAVPVVYLQDNKGDLRDSAGRRWRLAQPSEYGVSAQYGLVELTLGSYTSGATEPDGMVAVYYPGGYSLGAYNTHGTFLGDVQDYFDSTATSVRLQDYPQAGQMTPGVHVPGTVTINGDNALVVYEPGAFSPFEKQNRYLAPVNTSTSGDLVKLSTGDIISGYQVLPSDNQSLGTMIQNSDQNQVTRAMYQLIRNGTRDQRSPAECWPLGDSYPSLYLPGGTIFTEDMGLRFTNFSSAGAFSIGMDVVPGSVQVYRNGILDPNFVYSPAAGTVSLGNPAGFSEVIHITYLRQTSERRLGSLAAGIGAIWDPEGSFSGKLALGVRWNVSSGSYSENGATSPGTVGLGAEAKWDFDKVKAGVTLGLGYEQPDTTGLYRVAGMEESEMILSLPPDISFISETPAGYTSGERANLVYRNYRDTSILGVVTLSDISGNAPVISSQTGPYPANDSSFSSQVLAAEFELTTEKNWAGFQTPLGVDGGFMENAGKIEVPYRFMNFSGDTNPAGTVSVILQIGALADKDSGNPENPNIVMEKQLYPPLVTEDSNPLTFDQNGRIATVTLSDSDRVKLQGAKYLRLLVTYSGSSGIQGRVILAPPIVHGALWRPVTVGNNTINPVSLSGPQVNAYEDFDPALRNKYSSIIDRLHSENSRQRVLKITWTGFTSADYSGPGTDGRTTAVPLLNYRTLSFFVRRPLALNNTTGENDGTDQPALDDGTVLRFIIARGPSSLGRPNETIMDVKIPLAAFSGNGVKPGAWTKVEIQYAASSPRVLVEGKTAAGASLSYRSAAMTDIIAGDNPAGNNATGQQLQGDTRSSYAAFLLVPGNGSVPDGTMSVDEIILEDPAPSYRLNTGATVEWNLPGTILAAGALPVISDLSFQAAVESGAQGNPFDSGAGGTASSGGGTPGSFGMNGRTRAGFSFLGFRLSGNYAYSVNTSLGTGSRGTGSQGTGADYAWSGGHSISRSFGPLSIQESFNDAPADESMNHRLGLDLQTRVKSSVSAETVYDLNNLSRRWQAGIGGRPSENVPFDFFLDAQAGINEKTGELGEESRALQLNNYAGAWLNSLEFLVPGSGSGADSRDARGSFRLHLDTAPLGTELYFQGNSLSSTPQAASQTGSLARLDFPFNPSGSELRLLFRTEREYQRNLSGISLDYAEDGKIWSGSFGDSVPLLFSIPFYSLFDPHMSDRMDKFSSPASAGIPISFYTDSTVFADRFQFSLQRGQVYGFKSFFLPDRFSLQLSRVLEKKLNTPRDTFNIGAGLNFSSVNMFGAMGAVPVFNFYQGDQFTHSLQTMISFPRDEATSYSIRSDGAVLFFGFSGAQLSVNNTLTVNSSTRTGEGNRWSESLTAAWTTPMEKTLLGTLYAAFTGMVKGQSSWLTLANLAGADYEKLRNETLELTYERIPDAVNGDYNRFSVAVGHESIIRVFGHLNLSVYGKFTVSQDTNLQILSFLGTIGTTLTLMF